MKKILSWICIVIGLAVLVMGTSPRLFKWAHDQKNFEHNTSWWGEHHSANGDLVNMAYLDQIKTFRSPKDYAFRAPIDTCMKNIDLYLWGDSYVEDIPAMAFAHVNAYHFGRTYFQQLHYKLDKGKRNILIIESSERFARPYFSYKSIYGKVSRQDTHLHATTTVSADMDMLADSAFSINNLFDKNINQNIEYLLFNYNFINAPRFWKADVNYLLFKRGSGSVAISEDDKNLFIKETLLPKHGYSCYEVLPDNDIKWFVNEFDSVYSHYRAEGFDEVYLSIIPNPATILQPARYNHFLPRIVQHPDMHMPFIDLYPAFSNDTAPRRLYRAGDTHWNNNGMQVWLGLVNEVLRRESGKVYP